jgi:hypothetical protein
MITLKHARMEFVRIGLVILAITFANLTLVLVETVKKTLTVHLDCNALVQIPTFCSCLAKNRQRPVIIVLTHQVATIVARTPTWNAILESVRHTLALTMVRLVKRTMFANLVIATKHLRSVRLTQLSQLVTPARPMNSARIKDTAWGRVVHVIVLHRILYLTALIAMAGMEFVNLAVFATRRARKISAFVFKEPVVIQTVRHQTTINVRMVTLAIATVKPVKEIPQHLFLRAPPIRRNSTLLAILQA